MRAAEAREESFPQKIKCPVLITPRLVLRLPHMEDKEALVTLGNNAAVAAQFDKMPFPFRPEDAEDFVKRAAKGRIGYYVYAVTLADSGAFIGGCGIGAYKRQQPDKAAAADKPREPQEEADKAATEKASADAEVFLWLGEPYWRQGYGTEVVTALVDVAFRATELAALYARAREDNAAAGRVLQKCGFVLQHKSAHIAAGGALARSIGHYCLSRDSWLELRSLSPR